MAYKLAVLEIEKFVCISIYCVSALSLHIESTDSMIRRTHPGTTCCTNSSIPCECLTTGCAFVSGRTCKVSFAGVSSVDLKS